jgi:2-keto-4-pentenoate hydratase/2-oxohepta-3-ene-1,7-dioic acid hydratase in catechol pathway
MIVCVRYERRGTASYGVLDGDEIRELEGPPFESLRETGRSLARSEVRLLSPCQPSKVLAVGLNYKSHLGDRPQPEYPSLFAKFPTSIIGHEDEIVLPGDSTSVHYEGELVVVIGTRAKNVSVAEAPRHIFGVTAGNDVSERTWQRADLQWVRAKGSDTFGPLGPAIARGIDYHDLLIETRLNGELRQSERTRDMLFSVEEIVSYASRYVTLLPGDVIYTGTPGITEAMRPGDVVEVEVKNGGGAPVVCSGRTGSGLEHSDRAPRHKGRKNERRSISHTSPIPLMPLPAILLVSSLLMVTWIVAHPLWDWLFLGLRCAGAHWLPPKRGTIVSPF